MEYVYTALILHAAKQPINEENVKKVLSAAGVKVDDAKVKALVTSLEGVNIDDAIAKSVISTPAPQPPVEKKEEKKEEEKKESEEEAAAGLGALFG